MFNVCTGKTAIMLCSYINKLVEMMYYIYVLYMYVCIYYVNNLNTLNFIQFSFD